MNEHDITKSGIYMISLDDGRCYVGSALCIKNRWKEHRGSLRRGDHHSCYLQRAWNKYGERSFQFSVIEECSRDLLCEREQFWIDSRRPEFNILLTAGSWLGAKHTPEARAKMSIAAKRPKGRPRSQESREAIAKTLKGRIPSPQCRAACVKACKGKKLSEEHKSKIGKASRAITDETKAKLAKASTGRKHTVEARMKIAANNRRRWLGKPPKQDQMEFSVIANPRSSPPHD